jgi:hypothetical protein
VTREEAIDDAVDIGLDFSNLRDAAGAIDAA